MSQVHDDDDHDCHETSHSYEYVCYVHTETMNSTTSAISAIQRNNVVICHLQLVSSLRVHVDRNAAIVSAPGEQLLNMVVTSGGNIVNFRKAVVTT